MVQTYITFGGLNKKLLLPLILSLAQIILILVNKYYPEKENNLILQEYMLALGEMSIKLLPFILHISNKATPKEKIAKNKKCLHYFLLCFTFVLDQVIKTIADLLENSFNNKPFSYTETNLFPTNDFITMSFEMICMVVVSIMMLKYKYYKHHIISIIIFIIFGIICDIYLIDDVNIDKIFFFIKFIRLLAVAVEAVFYCYQKYMMEVLYYPYWNIAFIPGVFMFVLASVLLILALVAPDKENTEMDFVIIFYKYFRENDAGIIIGKVIIVFILHVIMCPLSILILYYFSPNFILIIFQLSSITKSLIDNPKEKLYCIIFFIFQIIALMIHLEILELNFCGLNKYTKRNIEERGDDDVTFEGRDSSVSLNVFDLNKDYYLDNTEKNEKNIEMNEFSYKNRMSTFDN